MSRRLVIDMDVCRDCAGRDCAECTASCSYPHHPDNNGIARLRELVAQELVCRQCELRSCVEACPQDALEKDEDGVLRRYNMRCTGCLSCSVACPFGTLVPAALQFRDSMCDYCAGRLNGAPECVETCPENAISFADVVEEPGLHLLGENLATRATVWQKIETAEET